MIMTAASLQRRGPSGICRAYSRAIYADAPVTIRSKMRSTASNPIEEDRAGQILRRGLAGSRRGSNRHRQGPLHSRHRDRGPAASQTAEIAARPRAHHGDSQGGRAGGSAAFTGCTPGRMCRGCSIPPPLTTTITSILATPTCSTTWCVSSASASRRWSRKPRVRRKKACRKIEIDYEVLPAVFDPEEAMSQGRARNPRQGRRVPHPAPRAKYSAGDPRQRRRRRSWIQSSRRNPRGHLFHPSRPARASRNPLLDHLARQGSA